MLRIWQGHIDSNDTVNGTDKLFIGYIGIVAIIVLWPQNISILFILCINSLNYKKECIV